MAEKFQIVIQYISKLRVQHNVNMSITAQIDMSISSLKLGINKFFYLEVIRTFYEM